MRSLFILIVLFPLVSAAQVYSKVIAVPGKSAVQLYSNAIEWFVVDFASDDNMVILEDPVAGKIIGKGTIPLSESKSWAVTSSTEWKIVFKIKLLIKDEKCKCDIFNIALGKGSFENYKEKSFDDYLAKKEYYKKASDWEWIIMNPVNGVSSSKSEAKSIAEENKAACLLIDKTEARINELLAAIQKQMKKSEDDW